MQPSSIQHYAIQAQMQDRMHAAATSRRANDLERPELRLPRLRWNFRSYSVPKMRSPASPKPGRM